MSDYIWVEVETNNYSRFLLKCQSLNINIYKVIEKDNLLIKILYKDFNKLNKIWFIKCHIISYEGKRKIKNILLLNRVFIIGLVYGIVMCYIASNVIVNVKVIHSDKDIRELVTSLLYEKGIKKNSFRKSYGELEEIKKDILLNNKDKLEWLEIERIGMNYIVHIEERKLNDIHSSKTNCDIIAKKDGLIKKIIYSKGESLVNVNDYVKKGDTLITGTIKKDEEIKGSVCATGKVLAESWYNVSLRIPIEEEIKNTTGKVRYNLKIKNDKINTFIFKSRLNNYIEDNKKIITLFGTDLYFTKQKETTNTTRTLSEEEIINKALSLTDEKMKAILQDTDEIKLKKVLKKTKNDSTMDIDVFVITMEEIGEQKLIE